MKVMRLQNTFPNLAFCTDYILSRAGKKRRFVGKSFNVSRCLRSVRVF